jgi:Dirigent-like protein
MHRVRRLAPVAVAVIVLGIAPASNASVRQSGGRTLRFTERNDAGTFRLIDNPPKTRTSGPNAKLSLGDVTVFRNPLFDAANARRVGHIAGICTVIKGGTVARALVYCAVGMQLRRGSIEFQGTGNLSGRAASIAIVGGTGAYAGARGSLRSATGARTSTDVVHLLP